jgi:hypothetical protein
MICWRAGGLRCRRGQYEDCRLGDSVPEMCWQVEYLFRVDGCLEQARAPTTHCTLAGARLHGRSWARAPEAIFDSERHQHK